MKTIKTTQYFFDKRLHTTKLTYDDDTVKYIFVEYGMIFVCDFDYEELSRHAAAGDIDSYKAYDTCDGCSYYLDDELSEEISDALLNFVNRSLLMLSANN